MVYPTSRSLSTNRTQEYVNQTGHGFVVGDLVAFVNFNPAAPWELSEGSSIANSKGTCMVSRVINADAFVATQVGHVSGITDPSIFPLTAGIQYYLSPTLGGALTSTKPTTVGQILLACFVADSTSSGYFTGGTGGEIVAVGPSMTWVTIVANTAMVVNTGYICNSVSELDLTLPISVGLNDEFGIKTAEGSGGFRVLQNGGQKILMLDEFTTTGVGGRIDLLDTAAVRAGVLFLGCLVTDTTLNVNSAAGTYDVV